MRRIFMIVLAAVLLPLGAHEARADTLGQTQTFRVNASYDVSGASTVTSTLRAVGSKGYLYVDDRFWDPLPASQRSQFLSALDVLSSQFDDVIYPRSVRLWGSEATPGVDGDPHVVILLQRIKTGSGGYFETIHNYPTQRAPESNGREMVFVTADSIGSGFAKNYLAHEFQHLISFNQHELLMGVGDDLWLNEARSEYNVTVAGYSIPFEGSTLQRRAQTFLRTPSDSLTEWPNTSTDYAIASLFVHYVTERFGDGAVASPDRAGAAGTAALDAWLASHGTERFGDVFSDWMVAVFLNNRTVGSAYGYARPGLADVRVAPTMSGRLDASVPQAAFSLSLKEWQPFWVSADISSGAADQELAQVQVAGAPDVTWRGAVIGTYRDGSVVVSDFTSASGIVNTSLPVRHDGAQLFSVSVAVTHGSVESVEQRTLLERSVTVRVALGAVSPALLPVSPVPVSGDKPADGDLIRNQGQSELYVVWGPYRRYLTQDILRLYGFENRPVREVTGTTFFGYDASVYIRAQGAKQVYAVWPDGTKHWLNITAAQWDASGRDWGAIFTVNDAEVAAYTTGPDITR